MPVYFAHGFRWPRAGFTGIRVHVIFHNLEDASSEYIQNTHSQQSILASFRKAWPDIMEELDDEANGGRGKGLTLLEEYDPEDEVSDYAVSKPWAFVCDCVKVLPMGKLGDTGQAGAGKGKEVEGAEPKDEADAQEVGKEFKGPTLSMNVTELIAQGPGSTPKAWEALADLRDKIADGEKIDWWVIYNGDPERAYDGGGESDSEFDEEEDDESMIDKEEVKVNEDQQPGGNMFVPQEETDPRSPASLPAFQEQAPAPAPVPAPAPTPSPTPAQAAVAERPKTNTRSRGMMPPPIPPATDKEKGKRTPDMRAFPPPEKPMPPQLVPAPVSKLVKRTESGLKKKFFWKK